MAPSSCEPSTITPGPVLQGQARGKGRMAHENSTVSTDTRAAPRKRLMIIWTVSSRLGLSFAMPPERSAFSPFCCATQTRRLCIRCKAPWLWKADIDAAFRRIPIMVAHLWAAAVAFLAHGQHLPCALLFLQLSAMNCEQVRCGSPYTLRVPSVPLRRCSLGTGWAPSWAPWPSSYCTSQSCGTWMISSA